MSAMTPVGSECGRLEEEIREAHAQGRPRSEIVMKLRQARQKINRDEYRHLFAVLNEMDGLPAYVDPAASPDDRGASPMDPLLLLQSITAFIRRFVVLTEAQRDAVALWVLHTHLVDAAETTPYLAITSAEKRSGKTRLLEVLELLVAEPLPTANISPAAVVPAHWSRGSSNPDAAVRRD